MYCGFAEPIPASAFIHCRAVIGFSSVMWTRISGRMVSKRFFYIPPGVCRKDGQRPISHKGFRVIEQSDKIIEKPIPFIRFPAFRRDFVGESAGIFVVLRRQFCHNRFVHVEQLLFSNCGIDAGEYTPCRAEDAGRSIATGKVGENTRHPHVQRQAVCLLCGGAGAPGGVIRRTGRGRRRPCAKRSRRGRQTRRPRPPRAQGCRRTTRVRRTRR